MNDFGNFLFNSVKKHHIMNYDMAAIRKYLIGTWDIIQANNL